MHAFKGEHSQGAKGVASRKLWHALHAVRQISQRPSRITGPVCGSELRPRGELFGEPVHEQQMRWSRNGADLLLQVRRAVYNGTPGAGLGVDLTGSPMHA
jgi:hypothetical protein